MPKFVIIKKTRLYTGGLGYSSTPICQKANIEPGKIYDSYKEASEDADKLTYFNPVGFRVEVFKSFGDDVAGNPHI